MAKKGEPYLEAYKRACPDRFARSNPTRKRYQDDVARKLANRPEVKKYVEEIKAKIAAKEKELSEQALTEEIISRQQFLAYQVKIIKHFVEKDPEEYTPSMYQAAMRFVTELFKIEQLEEWKRGEEERKRADEEKRLQMEETKRIYINFFDDLPKDEKADVS